MRRREFITLLGCAATWPLAARAQQPKVPVIGFLNSASSKHGADLLKALLDGLKQERFIEGQNVKIEYRWAEGHYDQLPTLAADLVNRKVAAIVASGSTPSALAAKAATQTIPIIFVASNDPIMLGLVDSINRPGGNVTGVSPLGFLDVKKLELVSMLSPKDSLIAVIFNSKNPLAAKQRSELETAAAALGRRVQFLSASTEGDIDTAFTKLTQIKASALLVAGDPFLTFQREQLVELAALHRIPAIYAGRDAAVAGGLMAYGADLAGAYFQAGVYAGKVLMGTNIADLPVIQASKVSLIVNLKTAKVLGLEMPQTLLGRADEIIE